MDLPEELVNDEKQQEYRPLSQFKKELQVNSASNNQWAAVSRGGGHLEMIHERQSEYSSKPSAVEKRRGMTEVEY